MGPGLSREFWINLFSGTIHRNNFSHSLESFWFIVSAPEDVVRLCLVKIILKGRWKEANLVPSLPHKMLFFLFFSFFLFFFPSFLPFFFVLCPFLKVILNLFSYLQLWVQKRSPKPGVNVWAVVSRLTLPKTSVVTMTTAWSCTETLIKSKSMTKWERHREWHIYLQIYFRAEVLKGWS